MLLFEGKELCKIMILLESSMWNAATFSATQSSKPHGSLKVPARARAALVVLVTQHLSLNSFFVLMNGAKD